jgi:hypothetical protein
MSIEEAALLAAWTILLVLCGALAPRFRRSEALERPEPQPLLFDPLCLDLDGPVIDLEPA